MVHNLWCKNLGCHSLAQLVLHLRLRIPLTTEVANHIASFLKLPGLNIVARTETSTNIRYAFWNTSCEPFDFCRDQLPMDPGEENWLITCDFNFELLAFNMGRSKDRCHTVKVVSTHQQQDITDVFEASVAFSHDGMKFAVPVFVSGDRCTAIYDVIDDANSLLGFRREIFWPKGYLFVNMRRNCDAILTNW